MTKRDARCHVRQEHVCEMVANVSQMKTVQRDNLLDRVDLLRMEAVQKLGSRRAEKGQFFTPQSIARFMAGMFTQRPRILSILDAGAGVGSLSAALIAEACSWGTKPARIRVTAFEVEPILIDYLNLTLDYCCHVCRQWNIEFDYEIIPDDFIKASIDALNGEGLCTSLRTSFNAVIINPPYRKISSKSSTRRLLREVGIETSNLYAAFLWLAIKLIEPDGEVVAITPRSFCNGPYFFRFRKALLSSVSIQRIHVFEYRDRVFREDDVLQENVILHALKSQQQDRIIISASADPDDERVTTREVTYSQVVRPDDPELFIRVVPDTLNQQMSQHVEHLSTSLNDLGICVSTGRVVDFRVKGFLRERPERDAAPLIYPHNFAEGYIVWPGKQNKKPNAIEVGLVTEKLLVPCGWYVLVRRFSSKEEKRRLVAAVYDPARIDATHIGIENRLNYYHQSGNGLSPALARGLAAFINSTAADAYFRQFSGHTQVNSTDLRNFRYPAMSQLLAIGESIGETFPPQEELDKLVLEKLGVTTAASDLQAKKD